MNNGQLKLGPVTMNPFERIGVNVPVKMKLVRDELEKGITTNLVKFGSLHVILKLGHYRAD